MRKLFLLLPLVVLGVVLTMNTGCDQVTEECSSDEICTGKDPVTSCCTDGSACVWKYNGVEYPDTDQGLADLKAALDCSTAKSATVGCDIDEIEMRLQELMENTRAASMRK
ncbi:MAG: hypothetical protein WCX31_10735 [Salinivirgaceae bacterium]